MKRYDLMWKRMKETVREHATGVELKALGADKFETFLRHQGQWIELQEILGIIDAVEAEEQDGELKPGEEDDA